MKIGFRKFNLNKRVKARTTAKIKRKVKKTFIPFYGRKGMGWIKNPKRALYNKVYNKVTISPFDEVMNYKPGEKPQRNNEQKLKENIIKIKSMCGWKLWLGLSLLLLNIILWSLIF